jgi:hypothetical protein
MDWRCGDATKLYLPDRERSDKLPAHETLPSLTRIREFTAQETGQLN